MSAKKMIRKRKKLFLPVLLGAVLVGALGFTAKEMIYFRSHEVTDNAQIDADISPVIARVSGYVKEIRFTDNQMVKAGDTLVVLDDRDYRIKLQQAEAALVATRQSASVSRSAVTETKAGIETIQAGIEAAKVHLWKATEDFNRYSNLFKEHAVTKAQFDAVKAEKESAEANLAAAQSQKPVLHEKVNTSEQQAQAAVSGIATKEADVDYARLQLSYTVITAPVDGIVSKRSIQVGQLVESGQSLFAVVNQDNLYVTANFKETQMENVRPGEKVDVVVDAFPDKTINGTVESYAGATGAKFSLLPPDNATGNFVKVVQRIPVRVKLDTLEGLAPKLRAGMSAKVVVHTK